MKETRAAYRYAKSLIDLAIEQKSLAAVYDDMKLILDTCNANREFLNVLNTAGWEKETSQCQCWVLVQ